MLIADYMMPEKSGEKNGEKKKQIEIAKRMLEKGKDIEEIKELTELTEEEIKKLK